MRKERRSCHRRAPIAPAVAAALLLRSTSISSTRSPPSPSRSAPDRDAVANPSFGFGTGAGAIPAPPRLGMRLLVVYVYSTLSVHAANSYTGGARPILTLVTSSPRRRRAGGYLLAKPRSVLEASPALSSRSSTASSSLGSDLVVLPGRDLRTFPPPPRLALLPHHDHFATEDLVSDCCFLPCLPLLLCAGFKVSLSGTWTVCASLICSRFGLFVNVLKHTDIWMQVQVLQWLYLLVRNTRTYI